MAPGACMREGVRVLVSEITFPCIRVPLLPFFMHTAGTLLSLFILAGVRHTAAAPSLQLTSSHLASSQIAICADAWAVATKSELPGGVRRRATPDPIKSLISQTPLISCRSTRRFQISSNLISPPWGKFDFCVCLWLYQRQPDDGLSYLLLSLSLIFLASSITLGAFKTAQFASPATVYSEDD